MNYFIQMRIKDSSCKKNCDNEICHITVYVRAWEDYRELTNFTCRKIAAQKPVKVVVDKPLGAVSQIDENEPEALQALDFGIRSLNEKSNDLFEQKLVKVEKVFRQIVAGLNYSFEFTMGRSNCTKIQSVSSTNCGVNENSKLVSCKISVWDQPWLQESRYKLTRFDC